MEMKDAPKLAPFNPSSQNVLESASKLGNVNKDSVVYDLGSGDGRLLIYMCKTYQCKGVGIEFDPIFVERSRKAVAAEGLEHLIEIRHADICKINDIENATVVFMFLCYQTNTDLQHVVQTAYNSGAKILSNMFSIKYLGEPTRKQVCDGVTNLYLYCKTEQVVELPEEKETKKPEIVEKLEFYLDPLKNPWIIQIFHGAMACLLLILGTLIFYAGIHNIHLYNISFLCICLWALTTWVFSKVQTAVERKGKKEQ